MTEQSNDLSPLAQLVMRRLHKQHGEASERGLLISCRPISDRGLHAVLDELQQANLITRDGPWVRERCS